MLLPVLGRPYGEALSAGEINLRAEEEGQFYPLFRSEFPVATRLFRRFPVRHRTSLTRRIRRGRARLHRLLEGQHYRLAWWNVRTTKSIGGAFSISMNSPRCVLKMTKTSKQCTVHFFALRQGRIDGVRVDHVDGLRCLEHYCRQAARTIDGTWRNSARLAAPRVRLMSSSKRSSPTKDSYRPMGNRRHDRLDFMDEINALQHDGKGEEPLGKFGSRSAAAQAASLRKSAKRAGRFCNAAFRRNSRRCLMRCP